MKSAHNMLFPDSTCARWSQTVSDGNTFTGQFFQITSDTTVDNLGPLWDGWGGYGGRERWRYDFRPQPLCF